jgi:DNA modification methylase
LIWGDKKYVLPALLNEFAGQVDLIYIDPPFATGADFSFHAEVPASPEDDDDDDSSSTFTKLPSVIEQKAYRDTWGLGLDGYAQWFYEGVVQLRELLADTGSIYVHCDYRADALIRLILNEVFGAENFINEIVWKRTTAHGDATQGARRYDVVHDTILFFCRDVRSYKWNTQYVPFSEEQIKQQYNKTEGGRRYRLVTPTAKKPGGDTSYEWQGVRPPKGRYWAYTREKMQEFHDQGRLYYSSTGQPYIKYFLDERPGVAAQTIWSDIMLAPTSLERVNYPTQKPEALLDRIIKASSSEGDLVFDCFSGSGTTAVVAGKAGRRWIAADVGRFSVHTTRKRLLSVPSVPPFVVQNLGKYERQLWQAAEFGETAEARTASYRKFILDLYHATSVSGYSWLHGLKSGRMVHVGTVDAPVTNGDVKQIVVEFRKAVGTGKDAPSSKGVDLLGWDFAFELNEVARQDAERAGIDLRLVRIPREVLEKRAVEQGDIRFFELAALSVGVKKSGRRVSLAIDDFVIPLDDVPDDVQKAVTHWSQWIDYWAVDWDNKGDTFHNEWQTYRTRKSADLDLQVEHEYSEPGEYTVVVKVIDILGNDSTKTVTVKIAGRAA